MANDLIIQRTLYTNKQKRQSLNGSLSGIYETDWSTLNNILSPRNTNNGVIGNFSIVFESRTNEGRLYNNGGWVTPKKYSLFETGVLYKVGDMIRIYASDGTYTCYDCTVQHTSGITWNATEQANWVLSPPETCDDIWTYSEIVDDNNGENTILNIIKNNISENDWKIKIDKSDLRSYCSYGSITEYINSTIFDLINRFPASLWLIKDHVLENPYGINIYYNENNFVPDLKDNIKILYTNMDKYEVVETRYLEGIKNICGDPTTYNQFYLTSCKANISKIVVDNRYVYIKKKKFNGFIGTINDSVYGNKTYNKTNNFLILLSVENATLSEMNDYYYPMILVDNVEIYLDDWQSTGWNNDLVGNCGNGITTTCKNEIEKFIISYVYNDDNGEPCTLIQTVVGYNGYYTGYPDFENLTLNTSNTPAISYHIKPKDEYVEEFFTSLNDLQSQLLNRYTVPKYTSRLMIPIKNDEGDYDGTFSPKLFTWYTYDGWNIDVTSNAYEKFIVELTDASIWIDRNKSDYIYRMMTHESIKNLDWSLERYEDDVKAASYKVGQGKLKQLLRIYGREFDEIKKYIHGIELMNSISYDQMDNYPDGFLLSNFQYEGWMVNSIVDENNRNEITSKLYYGWYKEYTSHEMELEFYRRMILNSPHIARWKGTKHGLEMVMNAFGVDRSKWDIFEMVYVATESVYPGIKTRTERGIIMPDYINNVINSGDVRYGAFYTVWGDNNQGSYITYNGTAYTTGSGFYGQIDRDGNTIKTFTITGNAKLVIECVRNIELLNRVREATTMGDKIDTTSSSVEEGNTTDPLDRLCIERYYWGDYIKCPVCTNNPASDLGPGIISNKGIRQYCPHCHGRGVTRRYYGVPAFKGNTEGFWYQMNGGWWRDTKREIKLANEFDDIFNVPFYKYYEGMTYYVKNDKEYWNIAQTTSTHYWVLVDLQKALDPTIGWHNLAETELELYVTPEGTSISITGMEQVKDVIEGNNPHSGGSDGYDDGIEYIQNIGSIITKNGESITCTYPQTRGSENVINCQGIFKQVLDNSPECIWSEPQYYNMENIGFVLEGVIDTKKSWWCGKSPTEFSVRDYIHMDGSYHIYPKKLADDWCSTCNFVRMEDTSTNTRKVEKSIDIDSYNVVNCKNIIFNYRAEDYVDKRFFEEKILPYIEEMIPSNAILELSYEDVSNCGIGVMQIENSQTADQCKDETETDANNMVG
jgi:hypothetical protein